MTELPEAAVCASGILDEQFTTVRERLTPDLGMIEK